MSFEEGVPKNIVVSSGKLSVSTKYQCKGKSSLRWDFTPYDTLTIFGEIGYRPQKVDTVLVLLGTEYPQLELPGCFNFPIYSEEKQDVNLRLAFGRKGITDCFADVPLNFEGWKDYFMSYDRGHLKGVVRGDMNEFKIIIKSGKSGTIFLDNLVFITRSDIRRYPDYSEKPTNEPWFTLEDRVTESEKHSFQTIEDRFFELEWGGRAPIEKLYDNDLSTLRNLYKSYHIVRTKDEISGDNDINYDRTYARLIKKIAINYFNVTNPAQKEELGTMAVDMIDFSLKTGKGVSGYGSYGFSDACYLVKDRLINAGLLEKAVITLKNSHSFSVMYNEDVDNGISSDVLYNDLINRLLLVLLMEDSPEKVRDMRHLVSYHSHVALNYAPGTEDTFKPDGSHFHHHNAYPDRYGYYTMPVVCEFVRLLARTDFHITEEAHQRMKHNVEVRCFYKSQHFLPWAYTHNHVRPEQRAEVNEVLHMALAGTPDGKQEIDKDMAALYLLFMKGEKLPDDAKKIIDAGIAPAPIPQGHKTLSYFAKGLHRKDDWFISVGAHSRYVYQAETWAGRPDGRGDIKTNEFVNWGQTEIIYPDKPGSNFINNGWDLDGWDWTRYPGATTIKAPLDRFRTMIVKNIEPEDEHLRSDQPFVGGLDFSDGNGVFVVKIHGHDKYKLESFYATKTYFFFGDLMICLGSDITNLLPEYMTQTTLMQNALKDEPFKLYINDIKPMKDSFFEKTFENKSNWILDSRNVGYFIPEGQKLSISYSNQKSRDDHDTTDTHGIFETAWLDHGFAPENGKYEYAVKVKTTATEMKAFSDKMDSKSEKIYKVLQADKNAHIIEYPQNNTRAYVLFQFNYNLNIGLIKGVTHSSIVMTKETDGKLNLAVCDPDLRFYEGRNDDVDIKGVRHELPTYDHYWQNNESKPSTVKVFLNGNWKIDKILSRNGKVIQVANGITVVEFECQHGLTSEVVLSKTN